MSNEPTRTRPQPRLEAARRTNRWVSITPIGTEHLDFLYSLAIDERAGVSWRFHGTVPTRETFVASLWAGVLAQFVVVERKSGAPIGMVVAYNADQRNGFAYIGAVMSSTVGSTGIGIAAMDLFITYLFTTWPFRKLYAELPQYNLPMLGNRIGHLLREEGRLKEHTYYNGRWWDQVIVALYPEEYFTESRVARLRSQ